MKVVESIDELRAELAASWRPLVLVPTMGALHEGHASLVRTARHLAGDLGSVVVSIFVNPTQFGPGEDFEAYPRDREGDLRICRENAADVVFAPPVAEMYAPDASTEVHETRLAARLCGTSRPGHFTGVCTVVLKLLNIVRPDVAVFGKKDYQQLAVIRRLVRDLDVQVEIVGAETVREPDGLAMSSRNRYLTAGERAEAPAIRRALLDCRDSGIRDAAGLVARFRERMAEWAPLGRTDYAEVVDAATMQPVEAVDPARACVFAAAVFFGRARLIDNIELHEQADVEAGASTPATEGGPDRA